MGDGGERNSILFLRMKKSSFNYRRWMKQFMLELLPRGGVGCNNP